MKFSQHVNFTNFVIPKKLQNLSDANITWREILVTHIMSIIKKEFITTEMFTNVIFYFPAEFSV